MNGYVYEVTWEGQQSREPARVIATSSRRAAARARRDYNLDGPVWVTPIISDFWAPEDLTGACEEPLGIDERCTLPLGHEGECRQEEGESE